MTGLSGVFRGGGEAHWYGGGGRTNCGWAEFNTEFDPNLRTGNENKPVNFTYHLWKRIN